VRVPKKTWIARGSSLTTSILCGVVWMRTRDATATASSSSKGINKDSSRDSNKVSAVSKGSKVKKVDKDKKDRKARLNRASAAKAAGRDPSRVSSKRADRKTVVLPT